MFVLSGDSGGIQLSGFGEAASARDGLTPGVRVRCRRSISRRSLPGWKCFGKLLKTRDSRLKMRSIFRA